MPRKKKDEDTNHNTEPYSDEIWACIRAVYEADGKISLNELREVIINFTQEEEIPSITTISQRAKRENWEKPQQLRKKSNAQIQKILLRAKNLAKLMDEELENDNYSDSNQYDKREGRADIDTDEYEKNKRKVLKDTHSRVKHLMSDYAHRKKNIAQIITRGRRENDRLRNFINAVTDELIVSKALLTNPEFRLLAQPEDIEAVEKTYGMNYGLIEPLQMLVISSEKLLKTDFALYGITIEDTREPETAGRMSNLEDETAYNNAIERNRQKMIELKQRREFIESGALETEVMDEIKRQMDMNNIEDAEFNDIDEDDDME